MNIGKMAEQALDCKSKDRGGSPLFTKLCSVLEHAELQIRRSSITPARASPAFFFFDGGRSRLKPVVYGI